MSIWRRHGKLTGFVAFMLVGIVGVWCGSVEENILALVPQSIKQSVSLFEHSPLSQKLIVITQAPSQEQAQEIAESVREELSQAGFIKFPAQPTDNLVLNVLSALPGLFSPQIQQETEEKISLPVITRQIANYYEELFSFQSIFTVQKMAQDPFNLTEIVLNKWREIGQGVQSLNYTNGFLSNEHGNEVAALYDAATAVSDIKAAQKLQQFFTQRQATLPPGARTFFVGGMRYTLENVSLIKRDLFVVSVTGIICLLFIFICFFRTKRALLVYLLPLLVLPPAAWMTQLIFGHISGITLGFGSVVVGLSVDYAIYIYFALQQTKIEAKSAVSKISKHLWCNFLTSGMCFIALLFSSIEVFRQIAVFALIALSLAFFISVRVLPGYFRISAFSGMKTRQPEINSLPFRWAVWVSILLLAFGIWGITHLSVSADLNDLNSTSPAFVKDKQIAERLFPSNRGALLFALGKTPEEALVNNELVSLKVPHGLPLATLFVSAKTREGNWNRWKKFWDSSRQNAVQLSLQTAAQQKGFNTQAFAPFWTWLQNVSEISSFDFSAWYNPLVKISNTLYGVVNIVPNEVTYAQLADGKQTVFISGSALQTNLVRSVKKEAITVVCLALLLNLIAVWLLFRNVKETLLCFIPVLLGGSFLFGFLALCKIQLNLFGLIFLPLLIGLGLDYAIFQLIKYRSRQEEFMRLYPARALLAAGLSTLAGFGVLVCAKHAVLFMMGICALVGIGGTVLVSLFILPSLWKHGV
ncbi:MAG: MMPL family transporter [Elusimicrobiaceae bacterium]|nr:MMPL family transporter [Elusimicrobiaceae bacterium]